MHPNPASSFKLGISRSLPHEIESLAPSIPPMTQKTKNKSAYNAELRRAAQTGNLDRIRETVKLGAELDAGENGLEEEEKQEVSRLENGMEMKEWNHDTNEMIGENMNGNEKEEEKEKEQMKTEMKKKILTRKDKLNTGSTALHFAAEAGNVDAVDLLLRLGANVDAHDRIGSTTLHRAISCKQVAVVEKLLQFSAGIRVVNKIGNNALHIAFYLNDSRIIALLLHAECSVELLNAKNRAGLTPLDYANITALQELALQFPLIRDIMKKNNQSLKLPVVAE